MISWSSSSGSAASALSSAELMMSRRFVDPPADSACDACSSGGPVGPGLGPGKPAGSPSCSSGPNTSVKTARRMSAWSLLDTRVASAQLNRSRRFGGRTSATAAANRSLRPGPTGSPAARSAAPNRAARVARSSVIPGAITGHLAVADGTAIVVRSVADTSTGTAAHDRSKVRRARGPQVLRVLEHRAHRLPGRVRVKVGGTEDAQRRRPADRLGDTWRLRQVEPSQPLDPAGHLDREPGTGLWYAAADNRGHLARRRVVDPVIQAAALESVMQITSAIGGEHNDGRIVGPAGAELGNRHRGLGQQFEQE